MIIQFRPGNSCFRTFVFYAYLDEFLEEHHRVMELRLQPVMREITDSRARSRDELESLYRKIVSCVLLRSGLGTATDVGVVREASGLCFTAFIALIMIVHHSLDLYYVCPPQIK